LATCSRAPRAAHEGANEIDKITRKELLAVPKREWDKVLTDVSGVYVIPSGRKRESGWACMDFVAVTPDGLVGFGGICDVVSFEGSHFQMDCDYPSRIIHIWCRRKFSISNDISSISFTEYE